MSAENNPIEHLYQRTLRVTNLLLDSMEQQYAPPPPPITRPPISDDPGVLAARRWLADQFALWVHCERTTCFRSGRCCGREVHCYRFEMERVPDDVFAGLGVYLDARDTSTDPRTLRGERGAQVAALIDWRRRFGLSDLPQITQRHLRRLPPAQRTSRRSVT